MVLDDASEGKRDAEAALFSSDLPILEDIGLALDEFGVCDRVFPGRRGLLEEHADDFIAVFIDEDEFGAESAALACELVDVVDAAQQSKAVHALVEVADALGLIWFMGF